MRAIEYVNVLRPSIDYLTTCGKLLLDSRDMAEFLGIPWKAMQQLAYTDRVLGRPADADRRATIRGRGTQSLFRLCDSIYWAGGEIGCSRLARTARR